MTVNVEVIEKWVEALESGDYKQGKGYLNAPKVASGPFENKTDRLFCCLGVLCELAVAAEVIPPGADVENAYQGAFMYGEHLLGCSLPNEVQRWAGFSGSDPLVRHSLSAPDSLAGMNDSGVKFPEIAQVIRDNFLEPA